MRPKKNFIISIKELNNPPVYVKNEFVDGKLDIDQFLEIAEEKQESYVIPVIKWIQEHSNINIAKEIIDNNRIPLLMQNELFPTLLAYYPEGAADLDYDFTLRNIIAILLVIPNKLNSLKINEMEEALKEEAIDILESLRRTKTLNQDYDIKEQTIYEFIRKFKRLVKEYAEIFTKLNNNPQNAQKSA